MNASSIPFFLLTNDLPLGSLAELTPRQLVKDDIEVDGLPVLLQVGNELVHLPPLKPHVCDVRDHLVKGDVARERARVPRRSTPS